METYIFATDFSQNAKHALSFAVPLIKQLNGNILLFHAFDYADPVLGVPLSYANTLNEEKEKNVKKQLLEWQEMIHKMEPTLSCTSIARRLPFEQNLLSLAKVKNAAGIFMGTKGASGLKKVLMGSNTASLLAKANCPVYAIPEESTYTGIKSIVYATDYQEENGSILDQIAGIARTFGAKLEILYVAVENASLDLEVYEWYQQAVEERLQELKVSFAVVHSKTVQSGISEYTKNENPDLIIMSMYKKNWIERLLSGSDTRKQVFLSKKPLLILQASLDEKVRA